MVDELEIIAKAHETNVARVALAWVQAQPGVTSIIIGARRLSQFEDNVRALDVNLSAEEIGPARRDHRANLRIPAEHAADGPGDHQRRNDGQWCLRANLGLRHAERRSAVLKPGRRLWMLTGRESLQLVGSIAGCQQ